jgi:FSR family fosmidomycin resistance protein-like MFS transporter
MIPRKVLLLSLGHLVTDINQGALPALLPFLLAEYHLSYTAAALLVFSSNIASTVVQPLFGHLADRLPVPWLMPGGILLAGLGLAMTGIAPSYPWVLVSVMGSGIGVAAFHPQGAWLVNRLAGEKASAMSVFGVGGTLGFALGPVLVTAALLHWGLKGSLVLAVPAALTAGMLVWRLSGGAIAGPGPGRRVHTSSGTTPDAWRPFARLTAAVVARAILSYGFNTFIPLYWIFVLHRSKAEGAVALTVFALSSVGGNLLGGWLADRVGSTRVAVGGFSALIPLVPALVAVTQAPLALAVLALIGFLLSTTYSPLVILGQQYLPNHVGLSSGVTLGIAITIGGVATPFLGQVADHFGLWATLAVLGIVPILSTGLALTLPMPDRVHARPPLRSAVGDARPGD